MYDPAFCNFSYWWIFPIVMMVLCFLFMRGRRGSLRCGFNPRSIDNHRAGGQDSAMEILDRRYASGEIDKDEYEEKKTFLHKLQKPKKV